MGLGNHHRLLPRPVVSRHKGGYQQYLSYLSIAFQGSGLSLSRAVILSASQSKGLRREPLLFELPGLRDDVLSSSEEEHIPSPSRRARPMATAHPQPALDSLDTT